VTRALGLGFALAVLAAGGVGTRLATRGDLHRFGWFVVAGSAVVGAAIGVVAGVLLSYARRHPRGRVAAFTQSDLFQGDPDD
jgi:hypothetical protein